MIVLSKNTLEHLEGANRGQYRTSLHQSLQSLMSFPCTCSTLVKQRDPNQQLKRPVMQCPGCTLVQVFLLYRQIPLCWKVEAFASKTNGKEKEPMTVEMLETIIEDAERSGSLSDLRLAKECLLGFSGFM